MIEYEIIEDMEQQPSVNQPNPPYQTAPPSSKSNLPLLLGALLLALGIGVSAFFLGRVTSNPAPIVHKDYFNPSLIPTEPMVTNILVSPTTVLDSTSGWTTFTDDQYGFTFKHPARYQITKPVPGGGAEPDGHYIFSGDSKADMFFLDVVSFSGNLDTFIAKYTPYDESTKLKMVSLNVTTPLGDQVQQALSEKSKVTWYKYINSYDKKVNPGAVDIISYSGFFLIGNKRFIIRSNNANDNLAELKQIVSTFELNK